MTLVCICQYNTVCDKSLALFKYLVEINCVYNLSKWIQLKSLPVEYPRQILDKLRMVYRMLWYRKAHKHQIWRDDNKAALTSMVSKILRLNYPRNQGADELLYRREIYGIWLLFHFNLYTSMCHVWTYIRSCQYKVVAHNSCVELSIVLWKLDVSTRRKTLL